MRPCKEARKELAILFQLPYSDVMQDWEWEVAQAAHFDEFLNAYINHELSEAARWSLMEVLIQSVEDMPSNSDLDAAWRKLEPLLKARVSLHGDTIHYWACVETNDPTGFFRVSPAMRTLLPENGGHQKETGAVHDLLP